MRRIDREPGRIGANITDLGGRPALLADSAYVPLVFVLFCALVYALAVLFPSYTLDDLWVYRRPEEGFPGRGLISVVQGRPVFWLLLDASSHLHAWLGPAAVSLVRAQAILFLALFGWGLFTWLRTWIEDGWLAFLLAIAFVTLPCSQMYVVGGPWLAWAFAFSIWAPVWAYRLHGSSLPARRKALGYFALFCGLGVIFATYQATPFVALAALAVPLFFGKMTREHLRFITGFALLFALALLAYFGLWIGANLLAGLPSDGRYSPLTQAVPLGQRLAELPIRIERLLTSRLPQIGFLWDVRSGDEHRSVWLLWVIGAGLIADMVRQRAMPRALARFALWLAGAALVLVSDAPAFLSPLGAPVFTYMTSGPVTLATLSLLAAAVAALAGLLRDLARPWLGAPAALSPRGRDVVGLAVAILCGGAATYTSATYYVLPAWIEHGLVRSQLREQLIEKGGISHVIAYSRNLRALSQGGRLEFGWTNVWHSFYLHWLTRRALEELGVQSHVRIDVRTPQGTTENSPNYQITPNVRTTAIVDLRGIVLDREGRDRDVRPSSWDSSRLGSNPTEVAAAARLLFAEVPGERRTPVHVTSSTFTFYGQSALGPGALTDGDLATSAADPNGATASTEVILRLEEQVALSRIRILNAERYGVESLQWVQVDTSSDGANWTERGTFSLKPGTSTVSEGEVTAPSDTIFVRLRLRSGIARTNIWLAEIVVFGR